MDDINSSIPVFKKIDRAIFERLDRFKQTPSYNNLQDFYNGLEEEQQKVFKAATILAIFALPSLMISFLWWQNSSIKQDLTTRISLVSKANEIIGQKVGLREVSPAILSDNPIDGESMMTSRLSNLLSSMNIDLSKIQVKDYEGNMISAAIMRSEAQFSFANLTTDELMNVFSGMIQREKFRISSVEIIRNPENNLLQGQFHGIHFSNAQSAAEEE